MSTHSTDVSEGDRTESTSTARRAVSMLARRSRDGSLAMVAGSGMLVGALRALRTNRRRATVLALGSVAALGLGMRQRRSGGTDRVATEADVQRDEEGKKEVSDEAYAEREGDLGAERTADESASVYQSETEPNPRGMTDRSDVEEDSGGDVDFVEGKEPASHQETHLESDDEQDTRMSPDDEEQTEVDLSEAAMADEVSEAAGPHPEQAYPAREGTDPEPTSPQAPERTGEGAVAPGDTDSDEDDTKSEEADVSPTDDSESGDEESTGSEDGGTGEDDEEGMESEDGGTGEDNRGEDDDQA